MFIVCSPSRQSASFVAFHQNEMVNFAVYALAHSDLKVTPFDLHETALPLRKGMSKADWPDYLEGLTKASWSQWIAQITRTQFLHQLAAQDAALSDRTSVSPLLWDMQLIFDSPPGYEESLYETYVIGAKAILGDRYTAVRVFDNPVDYWQGSAAVREKLLVLWNQFRVEPHLARTHFVSDLARLFDFEFYKAINRTIRDEVAGAEVFLPIFFVQYSEPVCYLSLDRSRLASSAI